MKLKFKYFIIYDLTNFTYYMLAEEHKVRM